MSSDLGFEPKLMALRRQLGETVWRDRIAKAVQREKVVLDASKLMTQGASKTRAAEALGVSSSTVSRWQRLYEAGGLVALIDRTGRVKRRDDPVVLEQPRVRRRTRRTVSFIKWAGSKASVMPHLLRFVPPEYGTYYEPMVGSGTLFFSLRPGRAVLSDSNAELMTCYEVIGTEVEDLIAALARHRNSYDHFIAVRAQRPDELSPVERAARFIYLNKTCYNGLYRVNKQGRFNTPYGRTAHANFLDVETLRRTSQRLEGVVLRRSDYRQTVRDALRGDFVYFDPPYLTNAAWNARYQPERFDLQAHEELFAVFRGLDRRGCHVVLSNSDLPEVHELYRGYHIERLSTRRQVHFAADKRTGYTELVISNRMPNSVPPQLKLLRT